MNADDLPYSQASENNKGAILDVLRRHLQLAQTALEIGGGTGQHAVFFAENFPRLHWQSSDTPLAVETLYQRVARARLANLPDPIALDVNQQPWPVTDFDAIYTANSLHIMSEASVENFLSCLPNHLNPSALLLVYGPFKYQGEFTSESNARFDDWLKERDPHSGIRDFEWINDLAKQSGLILIEDNAMPANNQLLVWRRQS